MAQTRESFEEKMLGLARNQVPVQLRQFGRLVRTPVPTRAAASLASPTEGDADEAIEAALARELGVQLGADEPESADVEFVEPAAGGRQGVVVQIRGGKISRVVQRG